MRGSSTSSVRWRLRAMTTLGAVALAGLAIVLVLGGHLPGRSGYDGSPVAGAWERVADTGSYRFRGEIEQTRAPGQGVLNAGRETRVDRMQLEGRADLTRSDVTLDVWSQGDSLSTTDADLSLRVQDGVSSRSLRGGPWQVTGAPGEAGAVLGPDGNPMTFLLAARDVSAVDTAVRGGMRKSGPSAAITPWGASALRIRSTARTAVHPPRVSRSCAVAIALSRPSKARRASPGVTSARNVCCAIPCTTASMFFTRWFSSSISSRWRSSAARRSVMSSVTASTP